MNTRQIGLAEAGAGSERSSRLDLDTGFACAGDCGGPRPFPLSVGLLAASHLGAALVSFEDPLLADPDALYGLERQYVGVPPGYPMGAYLRPVQAGPYAFVVWGHSP